MRRVLVVSALSLALLTACATVPPAATTSAGTTPQATATATAEDARLNAWFERKYEEQLQFSPIQLTFLGRKDLLRRDRRHVARGRATGSWPGARPRWRR